MQIRTTTGLLAPRVELTQGELERAFEAVQPKSHWKDPIDATLTDAELETAGGWDAVHQGVIHFTATVPTRTRGIGNWRIQAAGYWAGPAA